MQVLIPEFMSINNPDGVEPVPDAALMWDTQNATDYVSPGETVHFHVVNIGAFGYFHIWIEEHNMTVIEVDGVDVEPYEVQGIDVAVGQRVGILVKMNADPSKNYPIVGAMGICPPLFFETRNVSFGAAADNTHHLRSKHV
jgi:iron transport multicopper oxidase